MEIRFCQNATNLLLHTMIVRSPPQQTPAHTLSPATVSMHWPNGMAIVQSRSRGRRYFISVHSKVLCISCGPSTITSKLLWYHIPTAIVVSVADGVDPLATGCIADCRFLRAVGGCKVSWVSTCCTSRRGTCCTSRRGTCCTSHRGHVDGAIIVSSVVMAGIACCCRRRDCWG